VIIAAERAATRAHTRPLVLVALLCAAVLINYVDRGNLATAGPLLLKELHLSFRELGFLLTAFYWTYVLAMIPSGWLAEHYGAHRVLAVGVAIWSLATLLTGFAGGVTTLLMLRLLLGLGESATFPSASKLIATHVPASRLGLANGVVAFGYLVGPAIGTFIGGTLMAIIGWRWVFVIFGAASLLWLIPWSRLVIGAGWLTTSPMPAQSPTSESATAPSMHRILSERGLWGASLGHFAGNYSFYFILAWLPVYLVNGRGLSMQTMASTAGLAYLINALSALTAGVLADYWRRRGISANLIFKALMGLNHVGSVACLAGMVLLPLHASIACLFALQVVAGLSSPGYYAIPQIMAGPSAAGRWVGIQNTCGNIAGIVAPAMAGILVQQAGGAFVTAFALAAAVNVLGILGWIIILPEVKPVDWDRRAPRSR
jgi:MFS family permease